MCTYCVIMDSGRVKDYVITTMVFNTAFVSIWEHLGKQIFSS